jgi:hypothetical protein
LYCGVPGAVGVAETSRRVTPPRCAFCAASAMIWRARSVRSARLKSKNTRKVRAGAGAAAGAGATGATTGGGGVWPKA